MSQRVPCPFHRLDVHLPVVWTSRPNVGHPSRLVCVLCGTGEAQHPRPEIPKDVAGAFRLAGLPGVVELLEAPVICIPSRTFDEMAILNRAREWLQLGQQQLLLIDGVSLVEQGELDTVAK